MVKSGSGEEESAISKLRQTVASGIQEMGLAPFPSRTPSRGDLGHLTAEERSILNKVWQKEQEFEKMQLKKQPPPPVQQQQQQPAPTTSSAEKPAEKPAPSAPQGPTCRICRKGLTKNEPVHVCDECKQPVCDDCASYSKSAKENQTWRCSFCRRRQGQDRLGLEPPPGAGMHRVPSVRRMAERIVQESKDFPSPISELIPELRGLDSGDNSPSSSSGGHRPSFLLGSGGTLLSEPLKKALELEIKLRSSESKENVEPTGRSHSFSVASKRGSYAGQPEWVRTSDGSKDKASGQLTAKTSRSSSPDRRGSYAKDIYPSSETPSDRRSSSESQQGSLRPASPSKNGQGDRGAQGSHHHQQHHYHTQRHSSASESSLEEYPVEESFDRKRRGRTRRKSRMHRQKDYVEDDADSDSNYYQNAEWQARSNPSSLESSSALESIENDFDFGHASSARRKSSRLDVPTDAGSKPIRHIASDAALYIRRYSSESSDISDVSGDYSTHSDRSGYSGRHEAYHPPVDKLDVHGYQQNSSRSRKLSSAKPISEYDVEAMSPPGTIDSTPSPDDYDTPPLGGPMEVYHGCPMMQRSIPSVTVDTIGDQQVRRGQQLYTDDEQPRRCSTGSALPRIPIPENQLSLFPNPHGGRTRSTHSLDLPREEVGKPERRASAPEGENIKIVIDDVDSERSGQRSGKPLQKKIVLKRDRTDTGARTRGFGMRVMGGKKGPDGQLYAVVSWVLAGSPADTCGLKQGDVILEWNGKSLVNRTYEETCSVLDQSGDTAELVIENGKKLTARELRASTGNIPTRKSSTGSLINESCKDSDGMVVSPTRRKLPKTPDELCQTLHVQGEIGVQIWYDQKRCDLVVTVIAARGLPRRKLSGGSLPRAYVKLRLHPHVGFSSMKTPISDPAMNPEWNKTFIFPSLSSDELLESSLELSVWDHRPVGSNAFLGEVQIPLRRADLQDCPEWYPLMAHHTGAQVNSPSSGLLSPPGKSSSVPTPAHEAARRLLRANAPGDVYTPEDSQYLQDDDKGLVKSSSVDSMLLHPDDAWERLKPGTATVERKSSAPSVVYMQAAATSKSTPPSRRGSRQLVSQDSLPGESSVSGKELYASPVKVRERAKSASFRVRRSVNSDTEQGTLAPPCDPWAESGSSPDAKTPEGEMPLEGGGKRGPGQVIPRKVQSGGDLPRLGEIKLGFIMTKGQLEVEVVSARGLPLNSTGSPPDTYVKTYLKDGERQMQKRKTRVIRHSADPQYRQTLKYNAADVMGRALLVMIWERQKGFEHNQAIGVVEIQLDHLELNKLTVGWYKLFPLSTVDLDSNEST